KKDPIRYRIEYRSGGNCGGNRWESTTDGGAPNDGWGGASLEDVAELVEVTGGAFPVRTISISRDVGDIVGIARRVKEEGAGGGALLGDAAVRRKQHSLVHSVVPPRIARRDGRRRAAPIGPGGAKGQDVEV